MPRIVLADWIPRYASAGLDESIMSLVGNGREVDEFLAQLNAAISLAPLNREGLLEYVKSRQDEGKLLEIEFNGFKFGPDFPHPRPKKRVNAPRGFGQNADAFWFDKPDRNFYPEGAEGEEGTEEATSLVRIYVNGTQVGEVEKDLRVDRSFLKATYNIQNDAVVQVAIIRNGICGWWGKFTARPTTQLKS